MAADLMMVLQFSWPWVPQGRGKIERFFSTVNQMFLADLPGYAALCQLKPTATLDLAAFEGRFRTWLLSEYHVPMHGEQSRHRKNAGKQADFFIRCLFPSNTLICC